MYQGSNKQSQTPLTNSKM